MANDQETAFKKVQYDFTAHLRDPDHATAPQDVEDRRMEIYRGLFYRNIKSFIDNAYPVTHKMYSEDNWHKMVRDFFNTHQSKSPYFKDISKEFLTYLQEEREPQPEDPIFLNELAHYEWVEIYLTFSDTEIDSTGINPTGDLLKEIPVLSPLAELHTYNFPVHKIKPSFQPEQANDQPTFLLVYRDKQDKVGFMELNPITAMLVGLIDSHEDKPGQQLLDMIVESVEHLDARVVNKGGEQTLKQLRAKDIILGTKELSK